LGSHSSSGESKADSMEVTSWANQAGSQELLLLLAFFSQQAVPASPIVYKSFTSPATFKLVHLPNTHFLNHQNSLFLPRSSLAMTLSHITLPSISFVLTSNHVVLPGRSPLTKPDKGAPEITFMPCPDYLMVCRHCLFH